MGLAINDVVKSIGDKHNNYFLIYKIIIKTGQPGILTRRYRHPVRLSFHTLEAALHKVIWNVAPELV